MTNDLMKIGESVKLELTQMSVTLPETYSFGNALKAADLILREVVDRQKRPALEVCTPDSVHTAILDMAIQGLNPLKNQCYFIVYGNKLQMIRSYMGSQMVAKSVDSNISTIRAENVYEGDKIKLSIRNGKKCIESHEQSLGSISKGDIIAAYAVSVDKDDIVLECDLMTIEEIKQAWRKSKVNPVMESGAINKESTHGKFMGEMAKRTVINRLCKRIINTSDDQQLIQASNRTEEMTPTEIRVHNEIAQNANQKEIDFHPEPDPVTPDPKQEQPTTDNMATLSQAKQIAAIEKKAKRDKSATLACLSLFCNREISRMGELTRDEAQGYIEAIMMEMDEHNEQNEQYEPEWA